MTTAFDAAPDTASYRLNLPVVRFALRVLGWPQVEFAQRLGVDPATVSRMLNGNPTTAQVARRIVDIIPGLTVGEVVDLPGISPGLPPGAADEPPQNDRRPT